MTDNWPEEVYPSKHSAADLQDCVNRAHTALISSQYAGGPSERDARADCLAALAEYVTSEQGVA
jgi:hypothetical protein